MLLWGLMIGSCAILSKGGEGNLNGCGSAFSKETIENCLFIHLVSFMERKLLFICYFGKNKESHIHFG